MMTPHSLIFMKPVRAKVMVAHQAKVKAIHSPCYDTSGPLSSGRSKGTPGMRGLLLA